MIGSPKNDQINLVSIKRFIETYDFFSKISVASPKRRSPRSSSPKERTLNSAAVTPTLFFNSLSFGEGWGEARQAVDVTHFKFKIINE
jgi:hypothetical protein